MKKSKKKILVTGSSGQLGRSLMDIALNYPQFDFVFTSKSTLDITKEKELKFFFAKEKFDYCINCAAYTNVDLAEKEIENAFQLNATGVKNLALECNKYGIGLIHISTDYVFDGNKKSPYSIYDTPNPINVYGKSKLAGEQNIQEVLKAYYIVRTSWLYHKEYGKNFYKTVLEKAKKGEVLTITDSQTGCPTNAANLAVYMMELIVKKKPYGIYHFCDGTPMTWYDFAQKILVENDLQLNAKITRGDYKTIASRPVYSVLKTNQ